MDMDAPSKKLVHITDGEERLEGELEIPIGAKGCVVFAHGSGSNRHSPRNYLVAKYLRKHGFGTLRLDLLTPLEGALSQNRFNIELMSKRLIAANQWLREQEETKILPLGYFGSSTGAAAAITAAAMDGGQVSVIVSRGGRPDLAWDYLRIIDVGLTMLSSK